MTGTEQFEKTIGVEFGDKELLLQAFTHRSYINEHREITRGHNERLEFLGDAVLELVVTRFLFDRYPKEDEGMLTSYRSALVNTNTLSETASELGMNEHLLLSRGEEKDTGRARSYILANTYEAVVGAMYLDGGYEVARGFIERTILPKIKTIIEERAFVDAKSKLQEIAQDKISVTPTYQTEGESGPDHDKRFEVAAYLGDVRCGVGIGKSKQEAEQAAARATLKMKGWM